MQPARYTVAPEVFEDRRHELNVTLSFAALRLEEDGRLVRVRAASTLTDARRRAQRLRQTLADRHAHHRLLAACVDEIRDENYFHAVLEATKSLAEEIRRKTGLTDDGWRSSTVRSKRASRMCRCSSSTRCARKPSGHGRRGWPTAYGQCSPLPGTRPRMSQKHSGRSAKSTHSIT